MYFHSFFDDILRPGDFLVGDVVLFFEILEIEIGSDLTEFAILLEELGDLSFVGGLVDLVSTVKFLDVVHQSKKTVDLLFIFKAGPFLAAQLHGLLHSTIKSNNSIQHQLNYNC